MAKSHATELIFAPQNVRVEAHIVPLTGEMADQKITIEWWQDDSLKAEFPEEPIDRHWDWNGMVIELDGKEIESEKYAIVTGDDAVQGAMMTSTAPVDSILEPGRKCLFVELLFTAPRNRQNLRVDGQAYFVGVGTQLLRWGAELSQSMGYDGKIRLDGSPDYVGGCMTQ